VFRLRRYLSGVGRWPRLLLAGCCLLLALASAVNGRRTAQPLTHTVPVVVAARDLPAGHQLTRRDLRVARWPPPLRPAGARGDPTAVTGRRLAGPIGGDEPITGSRLIGADLAAALPRRLVAVAVTLDDEHAVELVRPGDRIDLLEAARPVDPLAGDSEASTRITELATHASVLAVLPATASSGAELVVAVDRSTAVRITRDTATHVFTAVVVPP
jgi:Flp pilus assembly protein CpaB